MTNIYVVTSGEYSDYKILGVFDTEENAQLFIDGCNSREWFYIENYTLNAHIPELRKGYTSYFVRMAKNGDVVEIAKSETVENEFPFFDIHNNIYATILAKDENHSIKIMNERRSAIIAAGRWGVND